MPIGNAYATGAIISFIEKNHILGKKLNVLDLGCGIGHNGFIFREMFEIRYLRLRPKQWLHRLEGIEIFKGYKNPIWEYYYDEVMIEDCLKLAPTLKDGNYDTIFATELLEHFKKDQAHFLVNNMLKKLNRKGSLIITIPVGAKNEVLKQRAVFKNIHETHRSYLTIKDFAYYHIKHKVNNGVFMLGKSI